MLKYNTSLPGLELMHQIDAESARADSRTMIPILNSRTTAGKTIFRAQPDERHLNPFGIVFGGFTCGLLDAATGMAAHSTLQARRWLATVALDVKFLRVISAGDELEVEGWTTHASNQLIVAESVVRDDQGRTCATGSAIYMVKELDSPVG